MRPIEFDGCNCTFAKDQRPYLPLPAHKTESGIVVSCWKFTWQERFAVLFTGKMWWTTRTFNKPLQPQRPSVESPIMEKETS